MPSEIVTAMNIVHPMSVVRGPYWSKSRANIGESAAEAIFAEPKLLRVREVLLRGHQRFTGYLQDTVGKPATVQEPFVDEADARRKQKTT